MAHWEKEVSEFPWSYSGPETFHVLEGRMRIVLDEGKPVNFGKGDLVTFPHGRVRRSVVRWLYHKL